MAVGLLVSSLFLTCALAGPPQFEQIAVLPSTAATPVLSSSNVGFAKDGSGDSVPAVYFLYVEQSTNKYWLWVSDGTASGTHLAATYPTGGSLPVVDPSLGAYVMGHTVDKGLQLYKTLGLEASTELLVDASPAQIYALDGQLSGDPVYEIQNAGVTTMWLASGTNGSAQKIGTVSSEIVALSDSAGFVISGQSPNYVVSTFSRIAPSLALLAAPLPDSSWIYPHRLGAGQTFACLKNLHQESTALEEELYCSDGTPAGTRRVVPPSIGTGLWLPDNITFTKLGSRLLFYTHSFTSGYLPWVTDGTDNGTYSLFDGAFLEGYQLCSDDRSGNVYFIGTSSSDYPNPYLWRSDGTKVNTKRVMPLTWEQNYCPVLGTSLGTQGPTFLYLGTALYQTDGSETGTHQVMGAPTVGSMAIVDHWLLAFEDAGSQGMLLFRLDLDRVFQNGFEQE